MPVFAVGIAVASCRLTGVARAPYRLSITTTIDMEHAVNFDWQFLALWVGVPLVVLGFVVADPPDRPSSPDDRPQPADACGGTRCRDGGHRRTARRRNHRRRAASSAESAPSPRIRGGSLNMPICQRGSTGVHRQVRRHHATQVTNPSGSTSPTFPTGSRWLFYARARAACCSRPSRSAPSIMWLAIALLRGRPFTVALTNTIGVAVDLGPDRRRGRASRRGRRPTDRSSTSSARRRSPRRDIGAGAV